MVLASCICSCQVLSLYTEKFPPWRIPVSSMGNMPLRKPSSWVMTWVVAAEEAAFTVQELMVWFLFRVRFRV